MMLLDFAGIIVMAVLGGARLRQILLGEWWALPLFLHAAFSIFLLIFHRRPGRLSPFLQRLTAWISALMPLAIQINGGIPMANRIISLAGVGFAIWTLIVLGKSFDVSPADRGLVKGGPYQWIRHPMYASELFSVLAIAVADLSLRNVLIVIGLIFTFILRIHWEEKIINGYQAYTNQVRSRLLPGVW